MTPSQAPQPGIKELEPRGKIFWMLFQLQKIYSDSLNLYIWIPDCETHKKMKGIWSKIRFYILILKLKFIHSTMDIVKPHYWNIRMWVNRSIGTPRFAEIWKNLRGGEKLQIRTINNNSVSIQKHRMLNESVRKHCMTEKEL